MNKYTGEVEIQLGGKACKIVYDWRALGEIQSKYGIEILKDLFKGIDIDIVSDVLSIGLKRHNPEMTKEEILSLSPAFIPTVQAIDKALAFAYFGASTISEGQAEQVSEDVKKKT